MDNLDQIYIQSIVRSSCLFSELSLTCGSEHLCVGPGVQEDLDHIGVPLSDGQVERGVVAVVQHNPVLVRAPLQEEGDHMTMTSVSCVM